MHQLDVRPIRQQFPILAQPGPNGQGLVYLDNAASTQKPGKVVDAIVNFYTKYYSNVGRGLYWPATTASRAFEDSRAKVSTFLNTEPDTIVFTSGTTDGINKVARCFLQPRLAKGDEVVISEMEHHSNLVPWQQLCKDNESYLRVIPLLSDGSLDYEAYTSLLNSRTRIVAITALSNTLGVINDVRAIIEHAHNHSVPVLVDAAQYVATSAVDVLDLDCDFLVFSGHKIYGPTGIGVLYGKAHLLEEMKPVGYGGGAVTEVTLTDTSFKSAPSKHEPGTPNIAGAIGLAAAIDIVREIGIDKIYRHTYALATYARQKLQSIDGLTVYGPKENYGPILSFGLNGIHPHDISGFLAENGIAIRAGHHCTQPLIDFLGLPGTCRASFAIYNMMEEIDLLASTLQKAADFFR